MVQGVRIEDMGHKMGCNGVDNGKLWFDGAHARLPQCVLCCPPLDLGLGDDSLRCCLAMT